MINIGSGKVGAAQMVVGRDLEISGRGKARMGVACLFVWMVP